MTAKPNDPNKLSFGAPWKCSECKSLLAYFNNEQTHLRFKYKDWYLTVHLERGAVTTTCRHCGQLNSVSTSSLTPKGGE